jgi:hypothetical protein
MVIGGERITNAEFAHQEKANAVGELPFLIRMASKQVNSRSRRMAASCCSSAASHNARKPALSMNTSAPAIQDLINLPVRGLAFRAARGAVSNGQKRIVGRVGRTGPNEVGGGIGYGWGVLAVSWSGHRQSTPAVLSGDM